ncbi:sensor histidine kinase [Streptomyces abyssomicinicus]|uniref:sensor histidine kinase n=1 Tax=Streptomyces abyssomicinicus TaxID=574929 RepID=UPI00124FDAF5|nr:sensor histidine kinase [Streptomyces abyssomicinicus]
MTTHSRTTTYFRQPPGRGPGSGLFHPALFYRSDQEYLDAVGRFLRVAVRGRGDHALVAVPGRRLEPLRGLFEGVRGGEGDDPAGRITWVDMEEAGRNPGRILSLFREFADRHENSESRPAIVGEPLWVGRGTAETREALRHEALVNLAFAGRRVSVLCPYDTALPEHVLTQARRIHPVVTEDGRRRISHEYADPLDVCGSFDTPLPEPSDPLVIAFGEHELALARGTAEDWASSCGLSPARRTDWLLAIGEATGNSVRHGGGQGTLRMWRTGDSLIAEIRDGGRLTDPLVGRRRPDPRSPHGGRGVWIMHQLCDLVEIRAEAGSLVLRLHMTLD